MVGTWVRAAALVMMGVAAMPAARSAGITSVSPSGEVAQVRQVVVRFDGAVLPFGDLRQPAPVVVACQMDQLGPAGAAPPGSGRWADDRTWLYDFNAALPPGARCTVKARTGWKPTLPAALATSAASAAATAAPASGLTGPTEFSFSTGGPAVARVQPFQGSLIEEQQYFLLQLTGPVVEASLAGRAGCEVEGIGELIPVRVVTGAPRDELIKARKLEKVASRLLLLACQRPLPNGAKLRLVWGAGIAALANPQVASTAAQSFSYTVRAAFTAEFGCERERANAPCLPIRPLTLRFSEPVARALAMQVRLKPATGAALAPVADQDDTAAEVSMISFPRPLAENARFMIELPPGLKDAAGRPLANAASFPLKVATGDAPPIAKFAAAPFGVIERAVAGSAEAVLPLTLRHVHGDLRPAAAGGQVRLKRVESDAEVLAWLAKLRRYHDGMIPARDAGLPAAMWTESQTEVDERGNKRVRNVARFVPSREVSLLKAEPGARRLDLPALQGGDPRPFEVVGIPLAEPGYQVVEIESARLGASLLDKKAPMFVRTGVLVTNLGLHFKHGRDNSLAWVTTLNRGQPVAGARIAVYDCQGKPLWAGATDASGQARIPQSLDAGERGLNCTAERGLFVTARHATVEAGQPVADMAFVFSSWQQGIEAWRFNLPTDNQRAPGLRAHTVFDRTLLRAGETVAMKHFVRLETSQGLAAAAATALPSRLKIVHEGSGQEFTQPLAWAGNRSGSATSTWAIPPAAKLGSYRVLLQRDGPPNQRNEWESGDFRVEEFRVPLVDARIVPPKATPAAPKELALDVRMSYLAGGAMAQAPLRATALLKPRAVAFTGYEAFSFEPPREAGPEGQAPEPDEADERAAATEREGKLVANNQPLTTDKDGAARWLLKDLPKITRPSELTAEIGFNDPNGEVQTVATRIALWPSAVVLGLRTSGWASRQGQVTFSVLALDTAGKPIAHQAVAVRGRLAQTISTRKRLVGGFYAYDNRTELKELGPLCSGKTDAQGLLACEAKLDTAGQVELVASAQDAAGLATESATSVWVTGQGELWFAQDNDDRIDLLPEKRRYEPGETARLQVRMPFRQATVLVAVEREGVIDTRVLTLRGDNPTVELKIDKAWGPNVYISVLAVRGRIREVPWYSFFSWGWKEPLSWARSYWYDGKQYQAPTAMVDLSKPAFKLGVAAIQVGIAAHTLDVKVSTDLPAYGIRQTATARIKVTQNGQPVAGTEVAFAAVDEGLLALRGNASWDLLAGMVRERAWGVETSTAQGEIIGRRHYGKKAVAAGGGGGRGGTRELFNTLLLWQPRVLLDANGEATVKVPLNDSLTSFRLVAVADAGQQTFGTGAASIRVTQDLQLLAGLPPLVREGDRFAAMLTLRNTTARAMTLRATLAGTVNGGSGESITRTPMALPPQELVLAAGAAKEISWPVAVPVGAFSITWEATADEVGNKAGTQAGTPAGAAASAKDRIKVTQLVKEAVPLRVLQATLVQLDGAYSLPVAAPADALRVDVNLLQSPQRGGLLVAVAPKLSSALPGIRRYFEAYPYTCLEQQASKAIGLQDKALWATLANGLPTYLDTDGLASYFPPPAEAGPRGSDRLTAYLLAASHEAGFELPAAARTAMLDGLTAFVQGRIERKFWSPRPDLDVRKLAAIEALARHGRAQPAMLGAINLTPNQWPTAALIDWLAILHRMTGIPDQARRLDEANQILRARLAWAGTTLKFSTEADDFWWWLMDSADANAARLILTVLDDPAWRADLPRLVVGSLGRQKGGAWLTTTANLWGSLALDKFSAKFESAPVVGRTVAGIGTAISANSGAATGPGAQVIDWAKHADGGRLLLPWPAQPGTLNVAQQGSGKPWLTVQSLAAIPLKAPLRAGYSLSRSITAVTRKHPAQWSRGDVLRIRLEVDAQADMSWVVISDPVPAGATILGSGLGRDSAIATRTERTEGQAWPAYEERSFEAFRSTYEFLPRGKQVIEYTVRLNNPGTFALPPSRVEAMYAPETFGELPNAGLVVAP